MTEENEEVTKEAVESVLATCNYPEFTCKLEEKHLEWGATEASYMAGFIGALNVLGLSEATIKDVILNKMTLEYQKEMLRMQLESEERVATIYSKNPVFMYPTDNNE